MMNATVMIHKGGASMYKRILSAVMAALLLAGCGAVDGGNEKADAAAKNAETTTDAEAAVSEQTEAETEAENIQETTDDFGFVIPSEAVSPDLSKEDPTDDTITFRYDDQGRVESYAYMAGGKQTIVAYSYDDDKNTVWILAYVGEIVAADETIELPGGFDPSAGFTEHNGYFFKGYRF